MRELPQPQFPAAKISYVYHHRIGPFPKVTVMPMPSCARVRSRQNRWCNQNHCENHGRIARCSHLAGQHQFAAGNRALFTTKWHQWKPPRHPSGRSHFRQEITHLLKAYGIHFSAHTDIAQLEQRIIELFATGQLDIPMAPMSAVTAWCWLPAIKRAMCACYTRVMCHFLQII